MKMVAASRLRRAQEQAEAARPYAQRMERMLGSLAANLRGMANAPPLLAGTGKDAMHLLVVATSDRGLAGGFNATILREARRTIRELTGAGKTVKLLTIGRKGRDALRRDYARLIVESLTDIGRPRLTFESARDIAERVLARFAAGEFDVCTIIYNRFHSAMTQIVTRAGSSIPFAPPEAAAPATGDVRASTSSSRRKRRSSRDLLPRNLAVQIFTRAARERGVASRARA